ncbi:hypothetical protein WMY93_033110 [Mugilogobius chulae]|uniref:G-protein coupled receptors family 1 profile domain-containing protein n=1 Tax=Mugilogobius chulae TaxID=88201 RepID=A0AAW0MI03_9GOBI
MLSTCCTACYPDNRPEGSVIAALRTQQQAPPLLAAAAGSSPSSRPCSLDESYKYVFLPLCYSLTFVFSLTLNSVVLLRSCRVRRRSWTTSLTYMVNLATTDLMYGLSLPFLVHSYVLRDRWVFGDFMCRLVRFLFYFNLYGHLLPHLHQRSESSYTPASACTGE